jgi:hypothetical protein
MGARYIVDENGKRVSVILDIEEYIRAYNEARAALERGEGEVIPLDQAMREIREK